MKGLVLALLPVAALGQLLPGGISQTSVSPTYEPVLFAVKAINEQFASTFAAHGNHELGLVEIVNARTQVVQGENLYLTLHLTGDMYCNVTVWYRSWMKDAERLQITDGPLCQKRQAATRMGLAGGQSDPMPLPQSDDGVLGALKFAACASNDRSNNMFASALGDTSGVTYTQQVTSGMTYRFYNVPMLQTTCRNTGCNNLDLTACHVNVHSTQPMTCSFVVQYQAWMTPQYTLTDLTC